MFTGFNNSVDGRRHCILDTSLPKLHNVKVSKREEPNTSDAALHHTFTYSLTPYSTVLLEKLTGSQLLNKFPAFYGTRRFITAFTSARYLSPT
jgi:hypothetical protein